MKLSDCFITSLSLSPPTLIVCLGLSPARAVMEQEGVGPTS